MSSRESSADASALASATAGAPLEVLLFPRDVYRNLAAVAPADLDALRADVWLMSPPCQPYTRQRSAQPLDTRDVHDKRAASFTHLTRSLPQMASPPAALIFSATSSAGPAEAA